MAGDRLALVPVERVLGGEAKYSAKELAKLAGVSLDLLMRQWQALGLPKPDPEVKLFGDEDLEAAEHLKLFVDAGLPENGILTVARVLGESMARVGDASRELVARATVRPGDTERDVGLRLASAAEALVPVMSRELDYVFRVHLREQLRHVVLGQANLARGEIEGAQEVTVCFADLVGFTRLGEALPPEELGGMADRLTEMTVEITEPPVRLVKTIGDAVMLVGPESAGVVGTAIELVDTAADTEDFPRLRSGVAAGVALERAGDWYGSPVNVASRVTGVARPSSVVGTRDVRDATKDDFRWSSMGRRKLKGVREPQPLYRARPPAS